MSFVKTSGFKYLKNLVIGVGASIVLIGALFKLESWPYASEMLILGLSVEALIFLFLGVIGPEKDYYWEKLYPGLEDYESRINPLTEGTQKGGARPINGDVVENQLGGMLGELQMMSKSLGSLKALQEVDFSKTGDQIKGMGNFYTRMNEAMAELGNSLEDTKNYKNQVAALNKNLTNLNSVYGNILGAYKTMGSSQS